MIDLSEEEKDWNISTTAKVCHTTRHMNLGLTIISIFNGQRL